MKRVENRTTLITVTARGQGAFHARGFRNEDPRGHPRASGRGLADELDVNAHFVQLDVRRAADWTAAVAGAERRVGPIHSDQQRRRACSVGADHRERPGRLGPGDRHQPDRVLSRYQGSRAFHHRAGRGTIVNIASTSSHVGTPMISPYVASKWGVRGLTQSPALELGRDWIRVNSISPGVVKTKLITEPLREGEAPVSDHFSPKPIALQRMAEPDEVTRLALFLSSDQSVFNTGGDYVIDGGLLLGPGVRLPMSAT